MGRLIAIDYGLKRVGLAVTDPLRIIATPLDTCANLDIIKFLESYFEVEEVDEIIVGFPKNLNNKDTHATQPVRDFVETLKNKFPTKGVILHDERFTSKMALDAMIAGGTSKKDRRNKGTIDRVSATIILQSYLESRRL